MIPLLSIAEYIIIVGATLGLMGWLLWATFKKLLYICGPNELLVFSGGKSKVKGKAVGYRIVKGGMSIRRPLVERVSRMDLTNMTVEVSVTGAYSLGGIPLTVQGVANLKVAGHQPLIHNALVRFLGATRAEIIKVAKNTLEGNLRGVLSQLTPEEVNEDKIAFAEKLLEEAESDLGKLGLVLDQLKVQNVSDNVGYLDSIGRKQSAVLQRRARIAEAHSRSAAIKKESENLERYRLAEIEAQIAITRADISTRIADTVSKRDAVIAEQAGQVKAAVASAEGELKVQEARIEQERRALQADILAPANAMMEASVAKAKADAAATLEDGKATAAVLDAMITTWQSGDEGAREIFLMQKMQTVMAALVDTIQQVRIDKLTVLPGNGERSTDTVRLIEELKAGVDIDIPVLLKSLASKGSENNTAG